MLTFGCMTARGAVQAYPKLRTKSFIDRISQSTDLRGDCARDIRDVPLAGLLSPVLVLSKTQQPTDTQSFLSELAHHIHVSYRH